MSSLNTLLNTIIDLCTRLYGIYTYARRRVILAYYSANGARIGKDTYLSPTTYIDVHRPGKVVIGDNCYITRNVVILCHTDTRKGGPLSIYEKAGGRREFGDVVIGDNVFIGVNSVVMPGVSIGSNAIIGALSLVTEDIPAGKVAVGVPAKVVGDTSDHISDSGHKR